MRDFAITPTTVLSLLFAGLRLRLHKNPAQLAQTLGITKTDVEELESGFADRLPTKDFIAMLDKMGVRLTGSARPMTGLSGHSVAPPEFRLDESVTPEPPVAITVLREQIVVPKMVYLRDSGALAHALTMAQLKSGKTQTQCAAEMGVNQSTLSKHSRDGCNVTLDRLAIYADYFGINFVVGSPHGEPTG